MEASDSTEAFTIKMDGHVFKPALTYQIFDDEKIFGHKRPKITLSFNEHYTPLYEFKSRAQEARATDIGAALGKFSEPMGLFSREKWNADAAKHSKVTGGTIIDQWGEYSVVKYNPRELARQGNLLAKLQILVVLFIEGGSYIDHNDNRWEIYFLKQGSKILGFSTVYPYLYFSTGELFDEEPGLKRSRISQFLVLPPYQRQGLGTRFLEAIFTHLYNNPKVMDITVEDATGEFDTLFERVSLQQYYRIFQDLPDAPSEKELSVAAKQAKSSPRLFQQLYEMFWLEKHGEDSTLKMLIKSRIWRQSHLELKDIATRERREKLELVYQNVVNSYHHVLSTAPSTKRPRSP